MTQEAATTTLTTKVYDALRKEILAGRIPTGSPLRLQGLASQFEVSMAVVREALIRLTERKLVTVVPNQGYRVVDISKEDLIDIIEMRVLLECTALRESMIRGDEEWEASVVAAHYLLNKATPSTDPGGWGDTNAWDEAHWKFHDVLGAACGRPRLLDAARAARDDSELYYALNSHKIREPGRDVVSEHTEICELAISRDIDAAVKSLENHLRATAEALIATFDEPSDD